MGNCLRSNRVMAQDETYLPPTDSKKSVEEKPAGGSAMAKPKTAEARGKKVVRFKLEEDEDSGDGGGVLRIKVVVSQKELKQILKDRENSSGSLEELIAELKVKGRTTISDARTDEVVKDDDDDDDDGSWRPTLKSIPENLS